MAWRRTDAQGVWDCFPDYVDALASDVGCVGPKATATEAALQTADSLQASVSGALEDANNGEGVAASLQLAPDTEVDMSWGRHSVLKLSCGATSGKSHTAGTGMLTVPTFVQSGLG